MHCFLDLSYIVTDSRSDNVLWGWIC